jgi:uncharacterized CHY-type Zn-finger protein
MTAVCRECESRYSTTKRLTEHRRRKHGLDDRLGEDLSGITCRVCRHRLTVAQAASGVKTHPGCTDQMILFPELFTELTA